MVTAPNHGPPSPFLKQQAIGVASIMSRSSPKQISRLLRVLIVEDRPAVSGILQDGLNQAGMRSRSAQSCSDVVNQHSEFKPDVVLFDLEMPDIHRLGLIRRLVALGNCALIVATENASLAMHIAMLKAGADYCIIKPVGVNELAARIRALHRRLHRPSSQSHLITVNRAKQAIQGSNDTFSELSQAEAAALGMLLDARGGKVTRDLLSKVVFNRPMGHDDRSVDQLILKLRRKLTEQGASARTILSVRGEGYVLSDPTLFRSGQNVVEPSSRP